MSDIHENENGNVSILFALGITAIAGCAAFAVEVSRLETTGDKLQDIADAAALGAVAVGQKTSTTDSVVITAAERLASSMLVGKYADASVSVNVISRTPTQVEVGVTRDVQLVFGGLLGKSSQSMSRLATAVSQPGQPVCLLVLEPSAPAALRLKGSPEIEADNCTVQVNSSAAGAISVGGAASIESTANLVVGPPSPDSKIDPKPQYNQPVKADPLEGKLPWPANAPCDHTGFSASKGAQILKPGVYCGGMKFASGANATLSPGVYVVQTGSVSFSANANVNGPGGVTIVLMDNVGAVSLQGGPNINLQAPTSGTWKGVVLAIKPQPTKITSSLQGGGDLILGGVVYMPTQHLDLQGGGDLDQPVSRGFITRTIDIQGNGELRIAGDDLLAGDQHNPRLSR